MASCRLSCFCWSPGFLSLFLSVFLIINTVSALVAQQSRQIGIMKSVGGRSPQIVAMYLLLVVTYGLLALVLAVPIGVLGAQVSAASWPTSLISNWATSAYPWSRLPCRYWWALSCRYWPPYIRCCRWHASLLPQAISNQGVSVDEFGGGVLDRWLTGQAFRSRRLLSRPLMLSLRNTFRRKGRLVLTLLTLTLGWDHFHQCLQRPGIHVARRCPEITGMYRSDLWVNFPYPQRVERVEHLAAEAPGVKAAAAWVRLPVRRVRDDGSQGDNLLLYAPPLRWT